MYTLTPEAVILFCMILIESVFIALLLNSRTSRGASELALFILVISLHNLVYAFETMAVAYENKIFWDTLQYIIIAWYPLILLHFANRYFNLRLEKVSILYLLCIGMSSMLTLVIMTIPFHDLFITEVSYPQGFFSVNRYTPHLFLTIFNAYGLFGGLLYIYFSFYMMVTEKGIYRIRGFYMMMMILIPLSAVLIYLLMKDYITFYIAPFAYLAGTLFPMYLYGRGKLFGPVPVESTYLLESLIDGVMILDRNGVILDFNRTSKEFFPQLSEELIGLTLSEASVSCPPLVSIRELWDSSSLDTGEVISFERHDGAPGFCEVHRSYDENVRHRLHASVLTIRDVSDLRSMAAELNIRVKHLEEDNRLKSLLIEVISHDIRSPLVLMKGLRHLMTSGVAKDNPALWKRGGEDLDSLIDRADALIGNMLALSDTFHELDIFPLQRVSLSQIVSDHLAIILRMAAKKEVLLTLDISKDIYVTANPSLLKSVIRNITENAVKYSPEGGTIRLKAALEDDIVRLDIENQGDPIPGEVIAAVQDRRWGVVTMGSAGEKGPGIGLYASQMFMKKMGGDLYLSGRRGEAQVSLLLGSADSESTGRIG